VNVRGCFYMLSVVSFFCNDKNAVINSLATVQKHQMLILAVMHIGISDSIANPDVNICSQISSGTSTVPVSVNKYEN
jgi:hypothetical protein